MRKLTVISLILGLFCIQSRAENSVHLLGGLPGPVYYDSSKPMEKGDACEIAHNAVRAYADPEFIKFVTELKD